MEKTVRQIHKYLDRFVNLLCDLTALITLVFLVSLFFQVMMRYIFNHPIYGIDEAVTAMMIWAMSLGFVEIYWNNENAVIEFIVARCPRFVRVAVIYVTEFIVLIMGLVLVPFSKAYYYALPVMVMGVLLVILSVFRIVEYMITHDDSIVLAVGKEGGDAE